MTAERWKTLTSQLVEADVMKAGAVDPLRAFTTEFLRDDGESRALIVSSCSGLTISKWWVARAARPPVFIDVRRISHWRQAASATQTHRLAID